MQLVQNVFLAIVLLFFMFKCQKLYRCFCVLLGTHVKTPKTPNLELRIQLPSR